jgi:hypothetical protein
MQQDSIKEEKDDFIETSTLDVDINPPGQNG